MLLELGKVSFGEIFVLQILDENEATEKKKKKTLYYILSKGQNNLKVKKQWFSSKAQKF